MKYYEHGDVILIPVDKIEGRKLKTNVIMKGEITGHAHIIEKTKTKLYMDDRNIMYVKVEEPAELTHEEHGKIIIPSGNYRIDRVKEYDPFEKELRDVQD